jgi:hypothetical protein
MPAGWFNWTPTTHDFGVVESGDSLSHTFINSRYADITVCKVEDVDENPATDADRVPVAGWEVSLYYGNGTLIDTQLTGAGGCYNWTGLMPGVSYYAEETMQTGWYNWTATSYDFGVVQSGDSLSHTFINSQETGDEGCTPGFWKNNAKNWGAVAWHTYSPSDDFGAVFGCGRNITLLAALELKGGGENALIRHAVAALLNAESPYVAYATSSANIISSTCAALASGDKQTIEDLKDEFDMWNNAGCSVDMHGDPIVPDGEPEIPDGPGMIVVSAGGRHGRH